MNINKHTILKEKLIYALVITRFHNDEREYEIYVSFSRMNIRCRHIIQRSNYYTLYISAHIYISQEASPESHTFKTNGPHLSNSEISFTLLSCHFHFSRLLHSSFHALSKINKKKTSSRISKRSFAPALLSGFPLSHLLQHSIAAVSLAGC